MKKLYITIGIVTIVLLFYAVIKSSTLNEKANITNDQNIIATPKLTSIDPKSPVNTVAATLAVLDALSSYYLASSAEQLVDSNHDPLVRVNLVLLKQNQYLHEGYVYLSDYTNDPNEFISVTAKGMIAGASQIMGANNTVLNYVQNVNLQDPNFQQKLSYTIAKHSTDLDSGFLMIARSAPQISALFFDSPKTDNPLGPIPYLLTQKERQIIIGKIDTLFGKDLKKYPLGYDKTNNNYITLLVAVNAMRNNIVPNTYEEASALKLDKQ